MNTFHKYHLDSGWRPHYFLVANAKCLQTILELLPCLNPQLWFSQKDSSSPTKNCLSVPAPCSLSPHGSGGGGGVRSGMAGIWGAA